MASPLHRFVVAMVSDVTPLNGRVEYAVYERPGPHGPPMLHSRGECLLGFPYAKTADQIRNAVAWAANVKPDAVAVVEVANG